MNLYTEEGGARVHCRANIFQIAVPGSRGVFN